MTKAIENALDTATARGRLADKQEKKRRDIKEGSKFGSSCFKLLQQIWMLLVVICGICMHTAKMMEVVKVHRKPNMLRRRGLKTAVKLCSSKFSNSLHSKKSKQLMPLWKTFPGAKLMDVKEMMAGEELTVGKDAECAQEQVRYRKGDFASLMDEFARLALSGKLSRRLQVAVG